MQPFQSGRQRADRAGQQPPGGLGVGPDARYRVVSALPAGHGQPHPALVVGKGDDFDQPDLAGAGQVGAAAGAAVAAGLHQPHVAGQFLFAAVVGAGQRLRVRHPAVYGRVCADGRVGLGLGLCQLFLRQRDACVHPHIRAADVEPHVLGPEQPVQRAAQNMLAGVLLHGVQPRGPVQAAVHGLARGQRCVRRVGDGLTVGVHGQHPRTAKPPGVTGLAAALGEEGRAVQHHRKAAGHGGAAYDLRGEILHIGIYFV